jgi:hypothetical protein
MLDITKAIRIEYEMPPSRKNTGRQPIPVYIFKCVSCENEVRTRKNYAKKHTGTCSSCMALQLLPSALKARRLRPFEATYNIMVSRYKDLTISYEEFLEFTKITSCTYCGVTINWKPYSSQNMNLDRMINELGHTKGNLVVCCGKCNRIKGNHFTYDEFMLLAPILKLIRLNKEKL